MLRMRGVETGSTGLASIFECLYLLIPEVRPVFSRFAGIATSILDTGEKATSSGI